MFASIRVHTGSSAQLKRKLEIENRK